MPFLKISQKDKEESTQGFTLVEISIVLVIISLIIGGVVTGQSLMRSASLRATIHQMEEYQAALNNFRARFQALPGDISNVTNHLSTTTWTALANGDGDGLIEDDDATDSAAPVDEYSGEVAQFWYQLHAAGMIPEKFDTGATIGTSFPKLETGRGGVTVGAIDAYTNIWRLCAVSATTAEDMLMENCLTPEEASDIDSKLDDGKPKMGTVMAVGGTTFDGDVTFYDNVWLPEAMPSFAAIGLRLVGGLLIPGAYAADVEITIIRDTCIFKDDDTGTAADQNNAAKYAVASGGMNCQLRISM